MTGLLVGALVYACLGQFEFLANIIYHIPILNMFRIPSRTLFLFSFAEMVLVALSLEALWKEEKHHTVLHHVNLAVAVGCVMVFLLYRQDMIPYDEKLPGGSGFPDSMCSFCCIFTGVLWLLLSMQKGNGIKTSG